MREREGDAWKNSYNGDHVQWERFRPSNRPAVVDDLLCLSEWREINIPTLTDLPYNTHLSLPRELVEGTLVALHAELKRQSGASTDGGVFIQWEGKFYSVDAARAIITKTPSATAANT
jgi:hypothetical protein